MTNQTGMAGNEHLVDMLIRYKFNVVGIFSPEHGFRGTADAGEHVASSTDEKKQVLPYGRFMEAVAESLLQKNKTV